MDIQTFKDMFKSMFYWIHSIVYILLFKKQHVHVHVQSDVELDLKRHLFKLQVQIKHNLSKLSTSTNHHTNPPFLYLPKWPWIIEIDVDKIKRKLFSLSDLFDLKNNFNSYEVCFSL